MRSYRKATLVLLLAGAAAAGVGAALPGWIENIEARTALEAAVFRAMWMPGGQVLFRRPPVETRPAIGDLIKKTPDVVELYAARAREDEQQLDFGAAENDWKAFAQHSKDAAGAHLQLADFYSRRLRPTDEIKALDVTAQAPAPESERFTPAPEQRSWLAFERALHVVDENALGHDAAVSQYKLWVARYSQEPEAYTRYFQYLLDHAEYPAAQDVIAQYAKAFPHDDLFPIKARALVAAKQGSVQQGLAIYDKAFQPLWPPELVQSYFDLMKETRTTRQFLDKSRAELARNPDDVNALARVFYYYQQQGKSDVAQRAIADYRVRKEERKSAWAADELYTLARLLHGIHAYPEAARYYYALYSSNAGAQVQERALAGLVQILLTAPEQPMRLGAGNLSMYADIGTMDTGPGFLNGILSLLLNGTSPAYQYQEEQERAVPYFHRAKGAELVALFDSRFPQGAERPALHLQLLQTYAKYNENDAVIRVGTAFRNEFKNAPQRTEVALLMADAYARTNRQQEEFAIYDALLAELGDRAQHVPLGDRAGTPVAQTPVPSPDAEGDLEEEETPAATRVPRRRDLRESRAFNVVRPSAQAGGPRSPEYSRVLDRYLSQLAAKREVQQALTVLRRELDRNPNDPGLYERLVQFLDQNRIGGEAEEVYRKAIDRFQSPSWYDKLARWYLRNRRTGAFEQLTKDVVRIFSGTELTKYFRDVVSTSAPGPQLYVRVNQYAHERFPHNLTFVDNLVTAYQRTPTRDLAAANELLRQYWFQDPRLRNAYFESLTRSGRLPQAMTEAEQNVAQRRGDWAAITHDNPAVATFMAEAYAWQSHFEQSAPVWQALAANYPAERNVARTASTLLRSLAYETPRYTEAAVAIEERLAKFEPGDRTTLARIGDIYADREMFAQASPYWRRMAEVRPGEPDAYLQSATVFWDYFKFDDALAILERGRAKLGKPDLWAYEEGAIYEGKREFARAVDEYVKGALAAPNSPAETRLVQLATRPETRELVNAALARHNVSASIDALDVRVAVLEAQNYKPELQQTLMTALDAASSFDMIEHVRAIAERRSMADVQRRALDRLIAITTDPLQRIELRYELARFYEGRKQIDAARREIDLVYRDNPKSLGVVRSTVDFYARNQMPREAVTVLVAASRQAYPALARQFTLEAARRATEVSDVAQARTLLAGLLQAAPLNAEYVAAMADTYSRAGDDQGLRNFYQEKIAAFRSALLPEQEKTNAITTLRRGLIPALTRLKDYAGAVDQYIEIINRFWDDASVTGEAALYAQRYGREQQLTSFYEQTVAKSPRDPRWAVVLARIEIELENFPQAIEAYNKAIAIRPDRVDLRTARAELNAKLMRFDDAVVDYEKLYELSYHNPAWMEKVAEVRARQAKPDLVVKALTAALIQGKPETPRIYFEVAQRLESWGMLPQAKQFAERGASVAGSDLLAEEANQNGAALLGRILARQRQYAAAYDQARASMERADASPNSVQGLITGAEKKGVAGVTDARVRAALLQTRRETARKGFISVLAAIGQTVHQYYTPEEKLAYAQLIQAKATGASTADLRELFVLAAMSAGLADVEAKFRYELLLSDARSVNTQELISLQNKRAQFGELASQLESYATRLTPQQRRAVLQQAADAYRAAGDTAGEVRTLARLDAETLNGGTAQQRYFELLLARNSAQLITFAGQTAVGPVRDSAANFVLAHDGPQLSQRAVAARAVGLKPVWGSAYSALTGLYFRDTAPAINDAFVSALGGGTIGESLGRRVDLDRQLAGDVWFYYASRYGEYRAVAKAGDPEDYLPAVVERTPARADAYIALAEHYADNNQPTAALAEYEHALTVGRDRADVHDREAAIYWDANQRNEAVGQWRRAIAVLQREVDMVKAPETFWPELARVGKNIGQRHLFAELRPELEPLIRAYLRKNGTWRVNEVLRSAFDAAGRSSDAVAWLIELSGVSRDQYGVLRELVDADWIPIVEKEPLYLRRIQVAESSRTREDAEYGEGAGSGAVISLRIALARYLLERGDAQRAQAVLIQVPQEARMRNMEVQQLELRIAAKLGRLDAALDQLDRELDRAPVRDYEFLRTAAKELDGQGDETSARKVLEFVFTRELAAHHLTAPNFLGLAEVRLQTGDVNAALQLLRRMALVAGDPVQNVDSAAALLTKNRRYAEAVPFLQQLVALAPWDAAFRVRLAEAQVHAGQNVDAARDVLAGVAANAEAKYETRAGAATALAGSRPNPDLQSAELKLLAGSAAITPAQANQPYFYEARLRAAQSASPAAQVELLRGALAYSPQRDAARLPLFRAALADHKYAFALAMMQPTLEHNLLQVRYVVPERNQPDDETSGEERYRPDVTWVFRGVPQAERLAVALGVAEAAEKLGNIVEAITYLNYAKELAPASQHDSIQTRIDVLQVISEIERANARRRPVIHTALEQDRVVRPRVDAVMKSLTASPAKGAKQ